MTFRMTAAEVQAHQRKLEKWRSGSQPGRKPTKTPDTFAYQAAAIENGLLTVWLPIRLVNGANAREHWAARRKRAEAHKDIVAQAIPRNLLPPLPAQVTITRYGPRLMDDDGNVISAKHVRDGIADAFLLDDSSHLIRWVYKQAKGEYGVRVEIGPRGTGEGE